MNNSYEQKYLKYKSKYLELKQNLKKSVTQKGGGMIFELPKDFTKLSSTNNYNRKKFIIKDIDSHAKPIIQSKLDELNSKNNTTLKTDNLIGCTCQIIEIWSNGMMLHNISINDNRILDGLGLNGLQGIVTFEEIEDNK